ncbi:hypothetical protein QL285_002769 [Trifolium repens]|nr:hypothetical protein QL285_002769 [Trifolium repens]
MECFFGDAILYKVEKDCLEEDEKIAHFKVISMCNEVDVVNKFIDEYLSIDENFELAHSTHEDYNGRSITLHWLFSSGLRLKYLMVMPCGDSQVHYAVVALFLSIGGSGFLFSIGYLSFLAEALSSPLSSLCPRLLKLTRIMTLKMSTLLKIRSPYHS